MNQNIEDETDYEATIYDCIDNLKTEIQDDIIKYIQDEKNLRKFKSNRVKKIKKIIEEEANRVILKENEKIDEFKKELFYDQREYCLSLSKLRNKINEINEKKKSLNEENVNEIAEEYQNKFEYV